MNNIKKFKVDIQTLIYILFLSILIAPILKLKILFFSIDTEEEVFIKLELIKFLIFNFVIYKSEDEIYKKNILFFSLIMYSFKTHIYMFLLTIFIQKKLKLKEYISVIIYFCSIFVYLYLYDNLELYIDNYLKYIYVILGLLLIYFLVNIKEIMKIEKEHNILNSLVVGFIIYVCLNYKINEKFIENSIKGYMSYVYFNINVATIVTLIIMYFMYKLKLKITNKYIREFSLGIIIYSISSNILLYISRNSNLFPKIYITEFIFSLIFIGIYILIISFKINNKIEIFNKEEIERLKSYIPLIIYILFYYICFYVVLGSNIYTFIIFILIHIILYFVLLKIKNEIEKNRMILKLLYIISICCVYIVANSNDVSILNQILAIMGWLLNIFVVILYLKTYRDFKIILAIIEILIITLFLYIATIII